MRCGVLATCLCWAEVVMSCTVTVKGAFAMSMTEHSCSTNAKDYKPRHFSQTIAAPDAGAAVIGSSPVALACAYQLLKCCHHSQKNAVEPFEEFL